MSPAQWRGFDRHRDLPMLGIDPDAKSDWEPIDNGLRPDNRDPLLFVQLEGQWEGFDYAGPQQEGRVVGARPDIGSVPSDHGLWSVPGGGRALMEYQRDLATAQNMSVKADELVLRTVGF